MKSNLEEIVIKFISAIENKKDFSVLAQFYHPEIEQIEFPNLLLKNKTTRNLNDLKEAFAKGKSVLQGEKYNILTSYIFENKVIIEAEWTGVLAIPIGSKKIGDELKANFAQFYEFKNGKIVRQRNYDCFEQF
jgi:ketosteroid isomerase-like protein